MKIRDAFCADSREIKHLKWKLENHCLCLKVANHHQTETPERAGGRTKINSDCDQFQV